MKPKVIDDAEMKQIGEEIDRVRARMFDVAKGSPADIVLAAAGSMLSAIAVSSRVPKKVILDAISASYDDVTRGHLEDPAIKGN